MLVSSLINESLYPLRKSDTVGTAREFMTEQGVTELPILDNKFLHNYARAVLLIDFKDTQKLEDVIPYNPHAPRIFENQHLYEIIPVFANSELHVLTVLNAENEFVGIVDQKSLHKQISQSLTYKGVGAIIQLNVLPADFAPSQIARLVEENGAKVLGMMVNNTENGSLDISLKINTTSVKGIVATFQRFNIKVQNCYMAEDYQNGSEKEYASVLRFFDI